MALDQVETMEIAAVKKRWEQAVADLVEVVVKTLVQEAALA